MVQILTEEEVLMLVVVRQVLQLLLAILQDTDKKAQSQTMTPTCKRRFPAMLLCCLESSDRTPTAGKLGSVLLWLNIMTS